MLTAGGGVLFVAAGALMIESRVRFKEEPFSSLFLTEETLYAGILSVIVGVIYLADVFM